jgi:hypothetical protein
MAKASIDSGSIRVEVKRLYRFSDIFPQSEVLNHIESGINVIHQNLSIRILQESFIEQAILKAGDMEFKKFVMPVRTLELMSRYILFTAKFHALQSAKVSASQVSKHQSTADFGALDDALVQKILEVLRQKPEISQGEMAEELGTTRRVIQKKMILLKEAGRIEHIGGKRYGHWIIHE